MQVNLRITDGPNHQSVDITFEAFIDYIKNNPERLELLVLEIKNMLPKPRVGHGGVAKTGLAPIYYNPELYD